MEPNKLENQFKEKLNRREINPSEAAWDQLDAMLSVADSSDSELAKQKQRFTWFYVAASFIGFLLVGIIFFNTKENFLIPKNNIVIIEQAIHKDSLKKAIKSQKKVSVFSKIILKEKTNLLVQIPRKVENNLENHIIKTNIQIAAENQPQTQNETLVVNNNSIPVNIDSLLASVSNKSISITKNSTVNINSTTLLNQVDGELQVSFREKALNTITKKYKQAREALANRNNQ